MASSDSNHHWVVPWCGVRFLVWSHGLPTASANGIIEPSLNLKNDVYRLSPMSHTKVGHWKVFVYKRRAESSHTPHQLSYSLFSKRAHSYLNFSSIAMTKPTFDSSWLEVLKANSVLLRKLAEQVGHFHLHFLNHVTHALHWHQEMNESKLAKGTSGQVSSASIMYFLTRLTILYLPDDF